MADGSRPRSGARTSRRPIKHDVALPWWTWAATGLVAFAIFAPTLGYELVWDDHGLVEHVGTTALDAGVGGLWLTDFTTYHDTRLAPGYYRPLVLLSLWLDGVSRTATYHATNVLFHVVASLLVLGLSFQILRDPVAASFAALLFAVHPVHVESVAFVSGRTDLLAGVFALASAWTWLRVRGGTTSRPALETAVSLVAFLMACLSKETAYLLPLALVIQDLALRDPLARPWRVRALPWWLGWGGCLAVVAILRWGVAGISLGLSGGRAEGPLDSAISDPSIIASILGGYIRLLLAPWPLNGYYTREQLMPTWAALIWVVMFVVVTAGMMRTSFNRRWVAWVGWTVVFLVPVSGIVPIGGAPLAERYLYVSSAGFAILAGMLFEVLRRSVAGWRGALGVAIAILGVFGWMTLSRSTVWKNDVALYSDLLRTTPSLVSAHYNLGSKLIETGNLEEAIVHLEHAFRLQPDQALFANNLGLAYLRAGRSAEALAAYRRALEIDPATWEAWDGVSVVLIGAGRLDEGIDACRRSIAIHPQNPNAHLNLLVALARSGRRAEAQAELATLARLSPEAAERGRAALRTHTEPRR